MDARSVNATRGSLEFYTRDRILSAEARRAWLEPDLKPLRWT